MEKIIMIIATIWEELKKGLEKVAKYSFCRFPIPIFETCIIFTKTYT